MCIGIPMQVVEVATGRALCADGEQSTWVDTRLVEGVQTGRWLLVFAGAARELISAERAAQVRNALQALEACEQGDLARIDSLFSDLVNREPRLPPHLQHLHDNNRTQED